MAAPSPGAPPSAGNPLALEPLKPSSFCELAASEDQPGSAAPAHDQAASRRRDCKVVDSHLLNLIIALRTNARFSSRQRFEEVGREGNHPLMVAAQQLRRKLLCPTVQLQPVELLQPFIDVVRSYHATAPITGVALSAFATFVDLALSFIDTSSLTLIAEASLGAQIEVVDMQGHEAVLARILQVLKAVMFHPVAVQLGEPEVLNILRGCFTIGMNGSPSELLRHAAEQTETEIVTMIFTRVAKGETPHSFSGVFEFGASLISTDESSFWSLFPTTPMVQAVEDSAALPFRTQVAATKFAGLTLVYHILATLQECIMKPHCIELLNVLRDELSRALLTISTDNVVVVSQMLRTLQLAWGFAADAIVPQFHTFMVATITKIDALAAEGPPRPPEADQQLAHGFEAAERAEVVLESLLELCSDPVFPVYLYRHYDLDLLSPSVFDRLCQTLSKLCEPSEGRVTVLNSLAANCLLSLLSGVEARSRGTESLQRRPSLPERVARRERTWEQKTALKEISQLFASKPKAAINKLRALPLDESGVNMFGLGASPSGVEVGVFLHDHHVLLDLVQLGDYLGEEGRDAKQKEGESDQAFAERREKEDPHTEGRKEYHHGVRKGFFSRLNFAGTTLLGGMRVALNAFRLSGESQKIDKTMEEFSKAWFEANSNTSLDCERDHHVNPFKSPDACFVFAFSTIMLNTDLHSSQVHEKMTPEAFVRNNRGTNDGVDVPLEYQQMVYREIEQREIKMKDEVLELAADDFLWDKAVHMSKLKHAQIGDESSRALADSGELEQHIFEVLCKPAIVGLLAVIEAAERADAEDTVVRQTGESGRVISDALQGVRTCAEIATRFGMTQMLDYLVTQLCQLTSGLQPEGGARAVAMFGRGTKGLLATREVFKLAHELGEHVQDAWKGVMGLIARLYVLGCLPEQRGLHDGFGNSPVSPISPEVPLPFYQDPGCPILYRDPSGRQQGLEDDHRQEESWLGMWFGSGDGGRNKEATRWRVASMRVYNEVKQCQVSDLVLQRVGEWNADVVLSIVEALKKVADVRTDADSAAPDPGSADRAVFAVHIMAEIVLRNGKRYETIARSVCPFLEHLVRVAAAQVKAVGSKAQMPPLQQRLMKQRAAYWARVGEEVGSALLRVFARLSTEQHLIPHLLRSLQVFNDLEPAVFALLAAKEVAAALPAVIYTDALNDVDAAAWELVIKLLEKAGAAGEAGVCVAALHHVAHAGRFAWPENIPSLVNGMVNMFLLCPVERDDSHSASGRMESPTSPGTDTQRSSPTVDALDSLQSKLVLACPSLRAPSPKFLSAWLTVLRGYADVVAAPPATVGGRLVLRVPDRSDALLKLQRAVLSSTCKELPAPVCYDIMNEVIVPLVEGLCESLSKQGERVQQTGGFFRGLSRHAVVDAVFGAAMADPDARQAPAAPQLDKAGLSMLEDMQHRVTALLSKSLLHFLPQLVTCSDSFLPLWRSVFGLLSTYYRAPLLVGGQPSESVREAVSETVKNIVNVAGGDGESFSCVPEFWPVTRGLLAPFGEVGQQLVQQVDRLSAPAPAVAPPPPPPPAEAAAPP